MDIIQLVLVGMIASIIYIILKDIQPTFAFLILLLTSFIIISVVITQINAMIQLLQTIGEKASIESTYIQTILKIIGIAYVTELGANIVKDAGLASVASKLELAGKIFILLLAIPIITAVIDIVIQFIPTNSSYLQ
ncbi:MAG TPA: stage III sporulation protein AD [Pseudogracilibacillus sp.]|nr:stage III sporulation protein AD [Pseudogracilibacillus sp.]